MEKTKDERIAELERQRNALFEDHQEKVTTLCARLTELERERDAAITENARLRELRPLVKQRLAQLEQQQNLSDPQYEWMLRAEQALLASYAERAKDERTRSNPPGCEDYSCGNCPRCSLQISSRVILESPYAGDVDRNLAYVRACMRDCLMRGEAPMASHALYTQPGVLDDNDPEHRKLGIEAGLYWGPVADKTVVYCDLGISRGMREGIERAKRENRAVEFRKLWY